MIPYLMGCSECNIIHLQYFVMCCSFNCVRHCSIRGNTVIRRNVLYEFIPCSHVSTSLLDILICVARPTEHGVRSEDSELQSGSGIR